MKNHVTFAILFSAIALAGCSTVYQTYEGVKGSSQAYHSVSMAKDAAGAPPAYQGYNVVVVGASLKPRDASKAAQLQAAFVDNMGYLVASDAQALQAPLQVCATANACTGRAISVTFTEAAYGQQGGVMGFVDKISSGSKLTGTLTYTDSITGTVVATQKLEMADDYPALMNELQLATRMAMTKSFPSGAQGSQDALKNLKIIKPGLEGILTGS